MLTTTEDDLHPYFAGKWWEDEPELKPHIYAATPTGKQLGAGSYGIVIQVKVDGVMYAAKKFRMDISMSSEEFDNLRSLPLSCASLITQTLSVTRESATSPAPKSPLS